LSDANVQEVDPTRPAEASPCGAPVLGAAKLPRGIIKMAMSIVRVIILHPAKFLIAGASLASPVIALEALQLIPIDLFVLHRNVDRI
jgi:hypothetical protein